MVRLSVRAKNGTWANLPPHLARDDETFSAFDLADADGIIAAEETIKKGNIATISGKYAESS